MNRLYRTLWYFNQTRKTFGLVQALAVTMWGYRNPWYRDYVPLLATTRVIYGHLPNSRRCAGIEVAGIEGT